MKKQAEHEIRHGKFLADGDAEMLWGWGTPAGKTRARRRAELIAQTAMLGPDRRVLEIGCGTGMFTEMFARSGCSIIAVDISEDLLKKARQRNLPREQVQFVHKRFEDCLVDGPFDAVIGSSVLHHLDTNIAFPKILGLLKPGGVMSFAEPNMLNPQIFIERSFRNFFPRISEDETAFVRFSLKRNLQRAGFSSCRITPFDWLHPAVPKTLIPLISSAGKCVEKVPGLREFSGSLLICATRRKTELTEN